MKNGKIYTRTIKKNGRKETVISGCIIWGGTHKATKRKDKHIRYGKYKKGMDRKPVERIVINSIDMMFNAHHGLRGAHA